MSKDYELKQFTVYYLYLLINYKTPKTDFKASAVPVGCVPLTLYRIPFRLTIKLNL